MTFCGAKSNPCLTLRKVIVHKQKQSRWSRLMQAFFSEYGSQILTNTIQHIYISFVSLLLGAVVAIPLGILLTRTPKIANIVLGFISALQTIPSFTLFTLMFSFFLFVINHSYLIFFIFFFF